MEFAIRHYSQLIHVMIMDRDRERFSEKNSDPIPIFQNYFLSSGPHS